MYISKVQNIDKILLCNQNVQMELIYLVFERHITLHCESGTPWKLFCTRVTLAEGKITSEMKYINNARLNIFDLYAGQYMVSTFTWD